MSRSQATGTTAEDDSWTDDREPCQDDPVRGTKLVEGAAGSGRPEPGDFDPERTDRPHQEATGGASLVGGLDFPSSHDVKNTDGCKRLQQ
jgi:hypothetical protein